MTIKQKKRSKIIGKNRTVKAELLEAGYSLTTATKQPPSVMKAKGWQKILDEKLPDEDLLDVHRKELKATKVVSAVVISKDADSRTNDFIEVPDHPTRLKAVELGYKVKGKLKDVNVNQQFNFGRVLSNEREEFKL